MAASTVGPDILETFDVGSDLALEIPFELQGFQDPADRIFLIRRNLARFRRCRNLGILQDAHCAGATDAVEDRQSEFKSFVIRNSDAGDTHDDFTYEQSELVTISSSSSFTECSFVPSLWKCLYIIFFTSIGVW